MSLPIFDVSSLKEFRKIGFIVPSSNVALEIITTAILAQLPHVSVHYSRVSVTTTDLSAGATSQFSAEILAEVAKLISNCPVETVLWNGTSESWTGEGYKAGIRIKDLIEETTKLPSSTSSLAQGDALKAWGIKKIALATPYVEENNRRLYKYYESCGVDVVKDSRLNQIVNNDIADTPVDRIRQLIRDADHPDAECIVIPCTNLPAALLVEEMEMELGKPIFDSIIVTLWKALRLINITTPIHGWGRLLRYDPVLEELDAVMAVLRKKTGGSRTTLRMDIPEHNCHVDRVNAESLAPGIPSLRPNMSLNQRAIPTVQHLEKTGVALIQPDTINAPVQPPKALMSVYGVKAQMLLPLMVGKDVMAWISVHYVPSTREWTETEVSALHEAGQKVCMILRENGWAEVTMNQGQ
jgi:maleate isomerase